MKFNMKSKSILFCLILITCSPPTVFPQSKIQLRTTINLKGELSDVGFNIDGTLLATTSGGKAEVTLWDVKTGMLKAKLSGNDDPFYKGLQGYSYPTRFTTGPNYSRFSSDGRFLAVAARMAREVRVWDLEKGKRHFTLTSLNDMQGLEFSPDGRILALAAGFQGLQLLDLNAGKILSPRYDLKRVNSVYDVAFIQGGEIIMVGIDSGEKGKTGLYFFEVDTGKLRAMIPTSREGHSVSALSQDGRKLALYRDNNIEVSDPLTHRPLATIKGIKGKIFNLDFSWDGKTIAAQADDNALQLWDAESGALKATISVSEKVSFRFSPRGNLILTAGASGVKIWSGITGEFQQTLSEAFLPLTFCADGTLLVTAGKQRTALLWEIPEK
jgi:WD40 repeat protein